ncbi:MAG: hypothetical protein GWO20_10815 [Candidatus Korarchaeota archaeon]|nr:hypothetical protein [Candidatus Korarchaeota archaeon]NIU83966.1 hypothetical protein [Candidatus Thorarchaeota archaeon]NIW14090.1 hypothetical protein [Candidatus Thorarchaeota archaeon]NIW52200.1 hypothetical protein [Candidatus Korarchaeota archaeon]
MNVGFFRNDTEVANLSGAREGCFNLSANISLPKAGTYNITVNTTSGIFLEIYFLDNAVDERNPLPVIEFPTNNSFWKNASLTVHWSATDDYSVDNCTVKLFYVENGSLREEVTYDYPDTTNHTFDVAESSQKYRFQLETVDVNGRENSTGIYLYNDWTPPSISITTTNEKNVSVQWLNLTWNTDENFEINRTEIFVNGSFEKEVSGQSWANISVETNGTANITVVTYDMVNLRDADAVNITFDRSLPYVDVTPDTYFNNAYFNTSDVTFTWVGTDTFSGIAHYEVRMEGSTWTNVGDDTRYTVHNLDEGSYGFDVKAVDWAKNENITHVDFTVDLTDPFVSISSPSQGEKINSSDVEVSWAHAITQL